jgi:hypothetical protein
LNVWEARPSSTFVSVLTCEFAENTKVMQRTPTPDRLPGMRGQPLREIMSDSPSMMERTKLNQGMNLADTVKIARADFILATFPYLFPDPADSGQLRDI